MKRLSILMLALLCITGCKEEKKTEEKKITTQPETFVPTIEYTLVESIPHDTASYTEGLLFHNQQLFESTGSPESLPYTKSVFGAVDPKTGKIDVKAELDKTQYFGEGITFLNDKVYQLTYTTQIGFIYDAKSFKQLGRFSFSNTEGWGLTTDGKSIIMSDGTNVLTYLDPATLKPTKTLSVRNAGYAEDYLNELEYINGFIYANIWMKNYIVKIDPATGDVVGILDVSMLLNKAKSKYAHSDVVNGIAYNPDTDKIYVTGKLWPEIYQINFKH
ncbi:MAG TPA: glutaminyl-peptide cyclotransferase [Bacteroidia bacterium]|jgi:glutamine cyclotransferase|nr:glutaminyl-peptide cyclotransferase [Bacteroidia bacterium]